MSTNKSDQELIQHQVGLKQKDTDDNELWAERSDEFRDLRLFENDQIVPPVYEYNGPAGSSLRISKYVFPDQPGPNAVFRVNDWQQFPTMTLRIYDKFGELVWQQSPYQNTWQGAAPDGSPLPDDRYFFRLGIGDLEELKGFFYLVRAAS